MRNKDWCSKDWGSKDWTRAAGQRALIVANGNVDLKFLTGDRLSRYDYIIGCDGGGMHLRRARQAEAEVEQGESRPEADQGEIGTKADQGETGTKADRGGTGAKVEPIEIGTKVDQRESETKVEPNEIWTKVDLLVGDFDSMAPSVLQDYRNSGTEIVNFPPEKDYTDLQLAVDLALERGYLELDLLGVTGNRLDHTMANLMLLYHIKEKGGNAIIIDSNNIIFAADFETEISASWASSIFTEPKRSASQDEGDEIAGMLYVSLVVIEDCSGITLEGFKYPLHEFHAKAGESRCVSNELLGDRGRIRFRSGRMLVFISRD